MPTNSFQIEQKLPVSVVINTKNAAATVANALKSVSGWASEIIVVDMKSTDETVQIAKTFTEKVFEYPRDIRYADPARNFANAKARQPWVFVLDADEVVPESLVVWIQARLLEPQVKDYACYWVPRVNHLFGQALDHTGWWPDYQPRLFQKGSVMWHKGVHRMPSVSGESFYIPAEQKHALIHYNYPSVSEYLIRLNRYTDLKSEELAAHSSHLSTKADGVLKLFFTEFLRRYFALSGQEDGQVGASLSLLQASYELVVRIKYLEKIDKLAQKPTDRRRFAARQLDELSQCARDLHYWIADTRVKQTSGLAKIGWKIRRKWCF